MAAEDVVIYKVGPISDGPDYSRARLTTEPFVIHEMKAKRTPKLVRLAERHPTWGWATNLAPDDVHFSPEDALAASLQGAASQVETARVQLRRAEARLFKIESLASKFLRKKGKAR